MDIGCSVGRICFELAASYDEVIGVDVSETALNAANQLRKEGEFPYTVRPEGQIIREYKAVVNPDIVRTIYNYIYIIYILTLCTIVVLVDCVCHS